MIATPINLIPTDNMKRLKSGIIGFDKLLGGGFVPGQAILFAGVPGAGKSTLVFQIANSIAKHGYKVLYATGEESLGQIKLRAERIKTLEPKILCSDKIKLEEVIKASNEIKPKVIIVDSLQMISSVSLRQSPGSPSQMKYGLSSLIEHVKETNRILIAIGHSTKAGLIAGMLGIQHMVDASFYMLIKEDSSREIFSKKNRFGESQISWVVSMTASGIKDPAIKEVEIETKTIKIKSKQIKKALENTGYINRNIIKSDFEWLLKNITGKKKKIASYDIIYQLEEK